MLCVQKCLRQGLLENVVVLIRLIALQKYSYLAVHINARKILISRTVSLMKLSLCIIEFGNYRLFIGLLMPL